MVLEVSIQPSHQWMDCGVAKAEGSSREDVGNSRVHSRIIAFIGAHVLPEGIRTKDLGDIIPHGDDL